MIIFISSVITSTFIGEAYKKIGRKKTFTVGAVILCINSASLMVKSFGVIDY